MEPALQMSPRQHWPSPPTPQDCLMSAPATSRCCLLWLLGVVLLCSPAAADLVRLKNGGEIRGTVPRKADLAGAAEITIVTLTGASVVVRRDDIEFVTPRSIKLELYEDRLRDLPDTVEAHWELAEWCRSKKLSRQRTVHLEAILLLDSEHEAAHQALGHRLHNGEWLSHEELMRSRGYVRHKRRWVTQQELDLIQKTEAERAAEQKWYGKVRLWLGWLTGRDADRKREGFRNLTSLEDADAVTALRHFLGEHRDADVRRLFVRILGQIPGPKPIRALVERSLEDESATIRSEAISQLNPEYQDLAIEFYVGALQNDLNPVVRRAALALRTVGTQAEIDELIDALVTQHQYKVTVRIQDQSYAVGSDGSIGMARGTSLPPSVEGALRAGQLPYGAVVVPPRSATRTKTVTVKRDERNPEVRGTLKELTGEDFGYDERTWRLWWAAQKSGAAPPSLAN